jgi:small-conductance mechanosensitive channel
MGADGWTLSDLADNVASAARHGIVSFWNFELFTAEDNLDIDGRKVQAIRSITIGKSLGVILLLLIGYLLTEWAMRAFRRLAIRQLGFNAGHTNTVLRWLHAIVLSMLFVVALYTVNIPLTVFAFLGGALAIGVGFGTQVLLKNMISGVMLLIERPLRVGDMVEVGSVVGTVTNISIRSSTVRTSDGIEILVPNSSFIENNVTNWTYSNAKVRRSVSVGVDYGASPERVSEVLLAVALGHSSIVADPPPRVLFEDFGSETMGFKLQYWIDYGKGADGSQIASELRFRMADALAAAGISIPLPQRVVYLKNADDLPA